MFHHLLDSIAFRVLFTSVIFASGFIIERLIPADRSFDGRQAVLNWMVGIFMILWQVGASALVASLFVKHPWSRTSSFLSIPDRGNFLKDLVFLYTWIAMADFFYYWLHRAQHKWEWLWAEHALHHSLKLVSVGFLPIR